MMSPTGPARRSRISLARALSKFGFTSRSQARRLIAAGKVRVNGLVECSPDAWVNPSVDRIAVEGNKLRARRRVYVALNKPAGMMTTRSDELGRKTVYELLPKHLGWLFPVGRLDKDTSGLLLFTNDTKFGEKITSPATKIPKTYAFRLDRPLAEADRQRMGSAVTLDDGTTYLPSVVSISRTDPTACTITILEGKNRQIRRLFEHFGYKTVELRRLSIGPIRLGDLKEGRIRQLGPEEVSAILNLRGA